MISAFAADSIMCYNETKNVTLALNLSAEWEQKDKFELIEEAVVMKKNLIWKLLLLIGICPFALPLLLGFYRMSIESWTLVDWLVMYSFVYWPTYIAGFVLIAVSVNKLIK